MAASTVLSTINSIPGKKAGSKNTGKSADSKRPTQPPTKCPECTSQRIWKDGLRYVKSETATIALQRFICRECGRRFSENNRAPASPRIGLNPTRPSDVELFASYLQPNTRDYKADSKLSSSTAGRDHRSGGREAASFPRIRLRTEVERKVGPGRGQVWTLSQKTRVEEAAGATKTVQKPAADIINFLWFQKKRGYPESTITLRVRLMKRLIKHGADLRDPESVLKVIAEQENWSSGYKLQFVEAYKRFAKMLQIPFDAPTYRQISKLPWIPTEKEVDVLISATGKKVSTMLQLIKETAMRSIEAWHMLWTDIDSENNTIRIESSKRGKPRIFKVSNKLIMMLNALPKKSEKVLGYVDLEGMRRNFYLQRKRITSKLQNPRLQRITFHTIRHWKATMEYHKTKDILHVKEFLGHRTINSTLVYTHLINLEADEYITRITKSVEGCRRLIEAGFQYVTDHKGVKIFKKPK